MWKVNVNERVKMTRGPKLNCLPFGDDVAVIISNEAAQQRGMYRLKKISKTYKVKISANKIKITAFRGKDLVNARLVLFEKTSTSI